MVGLAVYGQSNIRKNEGLLWEQAETGRKQRVALRHWQRSQSHVSITSILCNFYVRRDRIKGSAQHSVSFRGLQWRHWLLPVHEFYRRLHPDDQRKSWKGSILVLLRSIDRVKAAVGTDHGRAEWILFRWLSFIDEVRQGAPCAYGPLHASSSRTSGRSTRFTLDK